MKIKNKNGVMGENILMIYRLFLVTFIALVIFGLSAFFYDYYINVRNVEAGIMAKHIVNCMAPEGIVNLTEFQGQENKLLDFCQIKNTERFYVQTEASWKQDEKNVIFKINQGDSGAVWIKELFENEKNTQKIKKYEPGYFDFTYLTKILHEDSEKQGWLNIRIWVSHEF